MKIYSWVKGTRYPADANAVGQALATLEKQHGKIKPRHLVELATPNDSPLHQLFEWDNTKAADAYRTHQARNVIRCIEVVVTQRPRKGQAVTVATVPTRAYPHVPSENGYLSIEKVARDETRFQSALFAIEGKVAGLNRLIADLEDAARAEAPDKTERIVALREAFRRVDTALARIH